MVAYAVLVLAAASPLPAAAGGTGADLSLGHRDFYPSPEHPVGWRGDGTGQYPGAKPVLEWSETKNILWKTPMPAWTNSTPVPVGDKVFTCAEKATLLCCDASTGKILWSQDHEALGSGQWPKVDKGTGYTTATPICDGARVYARFGNGVVVAYTLDGQRVWLTDIGGSRGGEAISQSLVLLRNRLIFFLGGDLALALDAATGKETWKQSVKIPDPNPGSPVAANSGDVAFVLSPTGMALFFDGKIPARDLGYLSCNTSPMFCDGVVYAIGEKRGGKGWNAAVKLEVRPPEVKGTPLWKNRLGGAMGKSKFPDGPLGASVQERFFASPVLYEGLLITQNQYGKLYAFNPEAGEIVKTFDLAIKPPAGRGKGPPQGQWAYFSPAVAGGYLFIGKEGGPVVVFQGKELKEVARNYLEPTRSTMVFQGTRACYRGAKNLYCIGESLCERGPKP